MVAPYQAVYQAKQAANDLWIIREKYLSLLVDLVLDMRERCADILHATGLEAQL